MLRAYPAPLVTALAAASVLLAPSDAPLAAQTVVLDEGTFDIFVEDSHVGTETFTIRREGSGPDALVWANATVSIEGARRSLMRPVVKARTDYSPLEYDNTIEGDEVSAVSLDHMGRHFSVRISSAAGEREREMPVRPSTVLLEQGVAHHYWFLADAIGREGAAVVAVVPRSGEQLRVQVTSVTPETISAGGARVDTRRVTLTTGSEERSVWFDGQGRVLRVDVPATGYRAVRVGS